MLHGMNFYLKKHNMCNHFWEMLLRDIDEDFENLKKDVKVDEYSKETNIPKSVQLYHGARAHHL